MKLLAIDGFELIAKFFVSGRAFKQAMKQCFEIHRRAAGGDQPDARLLAIGDHRIGKLNKPGDAEQLIRPHPIQQMMANLILLGQLRLWRCRCSSPDKPAWNRH